MAWAAINGNGDKVFACLCPEDQADIGKKPNGRTNFNASIKYQAQLIKGMEITARKVLADDKVELKFKLDTSSPPKNGGPIPDFLVQPLVKFGGEWKICGSTKDTRRIGTTAASPSRRLRDRIGFCAQTIGPHATAVGAAYL